MDDDRIADRNVANGRADRFDPAGILVADRVREARVKCGLEPALEDMEIRSADAGAGNPDDDVVRVHDPGLGHVDELERLVIAQNACRLHLASA